jgi:hypothetical protein
LLAGIRFLTSAFPLRLLQSQWWLEITRELINISPVLITGIMLFLVTSSVGNENNPDEILRAGRKPHLLRWLAILYAALIPLQLGAAVLFDQSVEARLSSQLKVVQSKLREARDSQPGVVRNLRVQQLQAMQADLLSQRSRSKQRRFLWQGRRYGCVLRRQCWCGFSCLHSLNDPDRS